MEEIWKDIKGFEGLYKINIDGDVKNKKGIIKIPQYNKKNNVYTIDLYKKGKRYRFARYKLIAENFIPNPNNYTAVIHIDKNTINDKISNLKWVDIKETFFGKNENGTHIFYNKKEYPSIAALYEKLKKEIPNAKGTYDAFYHRIKNNWDFKEAIIIPSGIIYGNKIPKWYRYKYKGKGKTPAELYKLKKNNIKKKTFCSRLYRGWTVEEALEIPVKKRR